MGAGGRTPAPLSLSVRSHCHALITGSSGSGKSYALMYLLGCLLQDVPETDVYFCDFKNSEDFAFLKGYSHYYSGNDCYEGVMAYYESFCNARTAGKTARRHILIFDEYPAFISYLSTKDKQDKTKRAGDILGAVAEILMLGRGISYGIWIVTQRADATLFANGARDNFMVVLGLGRIFPCKNCRIRYIVKWRAAFWQTAIHCMKWHIHGYGIWLTGKSISKKS